MKNVILNFILFTTLIFSSCKNQTDKGNDPKNQDSEQYFPTDIWFDIHLTNNDEKVKLNSLVASDTSYWGIYSAPFFFRMPGHGNNSKLALNNGPFSDTTNVSIYALGEAIEGRMVDFGWLINTTTNDTVWKMTYENTTYAGGDKRNRRFQGELILSPGAYQLEYVTNNSHSSKGWTGEPPENPEYWGVLIYRTDVVKKIKNK